VRYLSVLHFVQASDLHLANPFGRFGEVTRVRLRDVPHKSIGRLAKVAPDNGAGVVLLAGDTLDAELPPRQLLRQALREPGKHTDQRRVVLPDNHDSLAATELWERVRRECPANVVLALDAKPIEIDSNVAILLTPPPMRHPGHDLTV
jgi:hypothetical protein